MDDASKPAAPSVVEIPTGYTSGPWWTDGKYDGREMGCSIVAASTEAGPLPGNPTRGMVAWASAPLNTDARRCEANARLIAIAPDLAAAYQEQKEEITALRAQVSALTAERDRLLSAQGWQDIETAPKDGTTVILCDNRVAEGYIAVASRKLMHGDSMWVHEEGTVGYPDGFFTHWMLPPAPPAPGGERG